MGLPEITRWRRRDGYSTDRSIVVTLQIAALPVVDNSEPAIDLDQTKGSATGISCCIMVEWEKREDFEP